MSCSWVPDEGAWNWPNMSTYLNIPEKAVGSEYALIYMNMSNCANILNIAESAEVYPNVDKYASICLTLWIWLYMPEI